MTDNDYHGKLGQSVAYVSRVFWEKYCGTLLRHGHSWEDVRQQSWVEVAKLVEEWPTNPTKHLHHRLLDWMRSQTGWSKRLKRGVVFQSFKHTEKPDSPSQKYNSDYWDPVIQPIDFESRDILRRLSVAVSQLPDKRTKNIFMTYWRGSSMKTTGETFGITESRVSQIIKKVTDKTRVLIAVGIVMLAFPVVSLAQAVEEPIMVNGCATLSWAANTESDLAGYQVFVNKDGAPLDPVDVAKTATTFPCADLPIVEGSTYGIQMTAYDTSGNASEPSEVVGFVWPDTTAPATPASMCVNVTMNDEPRQLCLTIN